MMKTNMPPPSLFIDTSTVHFNSLSLLPLTLSTLYTLSASLVTFENDVMPQKWLGYGLGCLGLNIFNFFEVHLYFKPTFFFTSKIIQNCTQKKKKMHPIDANSERFRVLKDENKALQRQIEALLDEERDRAAKRIPESTVVAMQRAKDALESLEKEKQHLLEQTIPQLSLELEAANTTLHATQREAEALRTTTDATESRAADLRANLVQAQTTLSTRRQDDERRLEELRLTKITLTEDIAKVEEELRFVASMNEDQEKERVQRIVQENRRAASDRVAVPMHQYLSLVHHTEALEERLGMLQVP